MKKAYDAPEAALLRFYPREPLADDIIEDGNTKPDDSLNFDDMFN